MASTRRDFLHRSAAVAAAAALSPIPASALESAPDASNAPPPGNAVIRAFEEKLMRAKPVPLTSVRVTGGPLKHAQEMDAKYLLELEVDRLMALPRKAAGLAPKAEPYGGDRGPGWDGPNRNLTGHIAGHYLSAVSIMYSATGDVQFKDRATKVVSEMKEVQDKRGDGYLGAIATDRNQNTGAPSRDGHEVFAEISKGTIRSGAFDLNGMWSPWYTLHKTFAGLRDAYRHTGNKMALDVELKFAGWAASIIDPMSDAQIARMLNTEHGGMNEVLADLYADTGDRKWLDLSYRFEHHAFTDELKRSRDNLSGKHGNCQIPKLMGSAARYGYTADAGDLLAATFFWDRVAQHHSYATGGHGLDEYFGDPDKLSTRVNGRTCESCNEYNMVKLTRRLFSFRPDGLYSDYHERALFNHILASMDPEDGRTSYMVPVGRGVQQEYQVMLQSFTCCVGTGMESHALHGDGIYFESENTAWVTLFVPSTAKLANGLGLAQETDFPDGDNAKITVTAAPAKDVTLMVRRPAWAGDGFRISVNGANVDVPPLASLRGGGAGGRGNGIDSIYPQPSSFVEIKRTWKSGDVVTLALPKAVHLEPTPDNKSVTAIMWGPLVLAGDHGPGGGRGRGNAGAPAIPALVAGDRPVTDWVVANGSRPGDFKASGVARVVGESSTGDLPLAPFWRTQRKIYSTYFDVLTPQEFDARASEATAEKARRARIEAATIAFIQPGDPAAERDYTYQSDPAERPVTRTNGRGSRQGSGWFSYNIPVDGENEGSLVLTFLNEAGADPVNGNFEILVDGTSVGRFQRNATAQGFFDTIFPIPSSLTKWKARVTVKFQAPANGRIAPIFGVRTIRGNGS